MKNKIFFNTRNVYDLRQALITKYLGPTNTKGSRIRVSCMASSMTIPWDHSLGIEENHTRAAEIFHSKLGWSLHNELLGGSIKSGFVFIQIKRKESK